MKKIILGMGVILLNTTAYSQENTCEKQWNIEKNNYIEIQKLKPQQCTYLWEDIKVAGLLKKMSLDAKNTQWMATDECTQIQVGQQKYILSSAYYKNDLSDLNVIRDSSNNFYGFFRDLGKYSFIDDKFTPTATANRNGVNLKCAALGNNPQLSKILIQYISQKGINLTRYSHEDSSK